MSSSMFSQAAIVLSGAALASAGAILPRQNSGSGGSTLSSPGAIGFAYPPLRGWSSETSTVQPCGGFALGGRTDFPLTGGQVSLVQARDGHDIQLSYSTNPDPQSLADFQPLLPNVTHLFGGTACLETPDFSSLGLAAGQVVTLQLQYNAGPQRRNFQQCADVTLVPSTQFVPASEYTCVNYTRSTQTRSGGNTAAASAGSSSSGSGTSLSLAGAGGIGAGVALVFAAAVLGLLTVAGLVTFGKKTRAPTTVWKDNEVRERDDASTLQGTNSREEKVVA